MAEEINTDLVADYVATGLSNKEIAEKISTEETPVSYQAIAKIRKTLVVPTEVVPVGCQTFSAKEYAEYSKANGRTAFGGEVGKKMNPKLEEIRALINSKWTPSMVLEKFQLEEIDLAFMVRELSLLEMRDKEIKCDFKNNLFR